MIRFVTGVCQARTVLGGLSSQKTLPKLHRICHGTTYPSSFQPFITFHRNLLSPLYSKGWTFFPPKNQPFKKRTSQLHCHLPIRFGCLRYNFWHPIKSWKIKKKDSDANSGDEFWTPIPEIHKFQSPISSENPTFTGFIKGSVVNSSIYELRCS